MGKYIIETDGTVADSIQGYLGFPIEICGNRTWVKTDVKLTHYIEPDEPDLDAIRKEAFEKGYSTAVAEQECAVRGAAEKGYQKGLSDTWETARKICLEEDDGGIPASAINDIFNVRNYRYAVKDYSASKAIEKIRQYEQEKEEIQVGDEVVGTYTGGEETEPFVIIRKIPGIDPTYYFGIYSKSGEFCQGGLKLKKTGRHFPEIAEVLQKMKESES